MRHRLWSLFHCVPEIVDTSSPHLSTVAYMVTEGGGAPFLGVQGYYVTKEAPFGIQEAYVKHIITQEVYVTIPTPLASRKGVVTWESAAIFVVKRRVQR